MRNPPWRAKLNPLLKPRIFHATVASPGSWFFSALNLKTAADRIDPMMNPIREDEPSLGLYSVYQMLLGMSIEALLKGILVAQGEQVLKNDKLKEDFTTHVLTMLAQKVDASSFVFSSDDLDILETLTPYIVWAGKYPLSKEANDMIVITFGSTERRLARDLWNRLYEHLRNIGWVSNGGGKRLYFNKARSGQSGP